MYDDCDWYDVLRNVSWLMNTLSAEGIGQIFKALFADENNEPVERDAMVLKMEPATRMLYEVIKQDACRQPVCGTCYKSTDCGIIE